MSEHKCSCDGCGNKIPISATRLIEMINASYDLKMKNNKLKDINHKIITSLKLYFTQECQEILREIGEL